MALVLRMGGLVGQRYRLALIAVWLAACAPRPQLLVTIQSDLPLPGVADDSISAALALDRVRAELLADDGSARDSREFPLIDAQSLPLSFGAAGSRIRIRVTGFDARWTAQANPLPEVAVTRLFSANATEV